MRRKVSINPGSREKSFSIMHTSIHESQDKKKLPSGNPQKRIMLTLGLLTAAIIACKTGDAVVPTIVPPPPVSATAPSDLIISPSPTAFMPIQEESIDSAIVATPINVPATSTVVVEAVDISTTMDAVDVDPFFISSDSFVLKNPTEIPKDSNYARSLIRANVIRLQELGILSRSINPDAFVFEFKPGTGDYYCRSSSEPERMSCYDNANFIGLQADVSMIVGHEPVHIWGNIPHGTNTSELLAASAAWLSSGEAPMINDTYLFQSEQDWNGTVRYFSAKDFVRLLKSDHVGMTDIEVMTFIYNYNDYRLNYELAYNMAWYLDETYPNKDNPTFFRDKASKGVERIVNFLTYKLKSVNPVNPFAQDNSYLNCRVNYYPTGQDAYNAVIQSTACKIHDSQ